MLQDANWLTMLMHSSVGGIPRIPTSAVPPPPPPYTSIYNELNNTSTPVLSRRRVDRNVPLYFRLDVSGLMLFWALCERGS